MGTKICGAMPICLGTHIIPPNVLWILVYRWRNWGLRILSSPPRLPVIKQAHGLAWIHVQVWFQVLQFFHSFSVCLFLSLSAPALVSWCSVNLKVDQILNPGCNQKMPLWVAGRSRCSSFQGLMCYFLCLEPIPTQCHSHPGALSFYEIPKTESPWNVNHLHLLTQGPVTSQPLLYPTNPIWPLDCQAV